MYWRFNGKQIDFSSVPLLMGIVNITPDSFFDGGRYFEAEKAVDHALSLVEEGAEIIDLGAESSRPGAEPLDEGEEIKRLIPVISGIRKKSDMIISVDTYKPSVAEIALNEGADIINDISAGQNNDEMLRIAAKKNAPLILMHMKGKPKTMQVDVAYSNVFDEVEKFLKNRIEKAREFGVEMVIADPGIGFGKHLEHNITLMGKIDSLKSQLQTPVLLGASRKSFIDHLLDRDKEDRLAASLAITAWAVLKKVDIIRVHDVKESRDVIAVISELEKKSYSKINT